MSDHSFDFECFEDNFTPAGDGFITLPFPEMNVEMTVRWHGAEPDVGISTSYPELENVTYYVGGTSYQDVDAYAAAVYALISEEIEESVDAVLAAIKEKVDEWEGELEDDE